MKEVIKNEVFTCLINPPHYIVGKIDSGFFAQNA